VARLDKNRHLTWYRKNQGLTGNAYTIAFTPAGNLYAGTTYGLFKFNEGRFSQLDLGTKYNHSIRKIFIGPDSAIYMATLSSGIIIMRGDNLIVSASKENLLANNVYAFFTDSRKRRLVGTAAGLYEIAGQDLKRVNRDGLLITRPVYNILEDHQGNLWVGTDNGVFRWNGSILDHFTVNDGLSGLEINRGAGFTDSQHHIWFGTNNGLTVFRPELDYKPGQILPPKVKLRSVKVGSDSLDPYLELKLPYDMDDPCFIVRVISLIDERQIFVKYYLEGFDTGWTNEIPYTGSRFAYNNLRPGSYRFFLKARNPLGTWSDPVVSATLTIRPPFWFQWWFLTLAILFFSGIVFFIARYILISRYKNRLMLEVSQQTIELRKSEKDLMESNAAKDSFFSIIAHDLRNPFNVILGYLDILTSDDSDYSAKEQKQILMKLKSASVRTFDLLENLLTWARSQRGSLPFEPEAFQIGEVIAENLGLYDASTHSKHISMITQGPMEIMVFGDRNMISTVIRNLVSNALKFTFPNGTIIIGIEQQDPETVMVYVKDNGMGISSVLMENLFKIEQRTVIKGTANETGTGLGLILCNEFINKNSGTIRVASTPGKGSTFTITLPAASST